MDPISLMRYTISGLMPLIFVFFTGAYFAKRGIFNISTVNKVNKLYSNFFNPMFIFVNIAGLDHTRIHELWPLFLTPSLMFLVGSLLAYAHSQYFKPLPYMAGVVSCIITFSNVANIPLVIMKGVCSEYGPLQGNEYCWEAGMYISIQSVFYNILLWSIGQSLIEKDKEMWERSYSFTNKQPLELVEVRKDFGKNNEEEKDLESGNELESNISIQEIKVHPKKNKPIWGYIIRNLLLPSPMASVLGFLISLVPGFQSFFYNKESKVYAIADACLTIAITGYVLTQMCLGANLLLLRSNTPNLTKSLIAGIVLFKNIITPLCALVLMQLLWICGMFGSNIVMAYVAYICFCSPTALVIMIMTQSLQYGNEETAHLMLWIYAFSLPTLVISTYLFLIIAG